MTSGLFINEWNCLFIGPQQTTRQKNAWPLFKINRQEWLWVDYGRHAKQPSQSVSVNIPLLSLKCVSEMKLCLIDKIDNSSTTQHCAKRERERGDTWKSQLPRSEKGVPNYWFNMMTPISPVSHYFFIRLTISTFCELFKFALPGKALQESNIIFDWGHHGTLRNVF